MIDAPGEIAIGCNVHDWMLSYIYAVNTPFYGRTSDTGELTLDVPIGSAVVHVRHPGIRDKGSNVNKIIQVLADQKNDITIKLEKRRLRVKEQIPDYSYKRY